MTTLLHLDSSARSAASTTRRLGREYVEAWSAAHPDGRVLYRDVNAEPLPFVSDTWVQAAYSPADTHDHTLRFSLSRSDALVAELESADHLVIDAPVYNFRVPAALKTWVDQVVRAGRTFSFGPDGPKGLLQGKTALIISASGSDPAGLAAAGWDFSVPYLRAILGFVGITEVEAVRVWGAVPADLDRTTEQARAELHRLAGRAVTAAA